MKIVVFAEGYNDGIFFREFIKQILYAPACEQIDFFIPAENTLNDCLKHADSTRVRRFLQGTSPYKILAKCEGGKGKAVAMFKEFSVALLDCPNTKIILCVDLDHRDKNNPRESFDKLLKKIGHNLSSRRLKIECENIEQNQSVMVSRIAVFIGDDSKKSFLRNKTFLIMAFISSLENETGIIKGDKEEQRCKKIATYVKKNKDSILSPCCRLFQ
jgi:hypothetical protein